MTGGFLGKISIPSNLLVLVITLLYFLIRLESNPVYFLEQSEVVTLGLMGVDRASFESYLKFIQTLLECALEFLHAEAWQ